MFLIVAIWEDDSETIFLSPHDPKNKQLPYWMTVFEQLDTAGDPRSAQLFFALVTNQFILHRTEEGFILDGDTESCDQLKPLKFAENIIEQWYKMLGNKGFDDDHETE